MCFGRKRKQIALRASIFSPLSVTTSALPTAIADLYWSVKLPSLGPTVGAHLVTADKATFGLVNCLLSYLYTLLMYDVRSALESVGLDSYVGFFHTDRPGRASLALDMMEEWRPVIADRLALSLINREQLNEKHFKHTESGAVIMSDEGRKLLLEAYQKRKSDDISHPYLKETVPVGLLFYTQALLLARFLRGDIDGYPAFLWK